MDIGDILPFAFTVIFSEIKEYIIFTDICFHLLLLFKIWFLTLYPCCFPFKYVASINNHVHFSFQLTVILCLT